MDVPALSESHRNSGSITIRARNPIWRKCWCIPIVSLGWAKAAQKKKRNLLYILGYFFFLFSFFILPKIVPCFTQVDREHFHRKRKEEPAVYNQVFRSWWTWPRSEKGGYCAGAMQRSVDSCERYKFIGWHDVLSGRCMELTNSRLCRWKVKNYV